MSIRPQSFSSSAPSGWDPSEGGDGGGGGSEPETETTDAGDGANGEYAIEDGVLTLSKGVLNGWNIDKNSLTATVTESSANNNCELAVATGGAMMRIGTEALAPNNTLLIYKEIHDGSDFDLKVRVTGAESAATQKEDNFFVGMWRKEKNASLPNYLYKSPSVGVSLQAHNSSVSLIFPRAHVARDSGLEFIGVAQFKYTVVHASTRWLRVKRTAGLFNIYVQEGTADDPDAGTWVAVDDSYCAHGSDDAPPHNYDICGTGAVIGIGVGGNASVDVEFFVERIILTYTPAEDE
jgi:hypothetical protein